MKLKCPNCGHKNNHVKSYSFKSKRKDLVMYPRRIRICYVCGQKFYTREIYVPDEIIHSGENEYGARKGYIYNAFINMASLKKEYEGANTI